MADKLSVLPIGSFPTPVERQRALGEFIGVPRLYMKRDDLSDPVCGGSKTRKLAFLLGDARRHGHNKVTTFGGVGSNHALATAVFGRSFGFDVLLMLAPELPSPHVREHLLLERGVGADVQLFASVTNARSVADRISREQPASARPYVIPPGGSSPVGNLGYVNAAFELQEQIQQGLLPEPDVLYLAMGTMGTAVGLSIGLKAAGLKTRLVAVRASSLDAASEGMMMDMFAQTLALARTRDPAFPAVALDRKDTGIRHGYVGRGYARPTKAGTHAMEVCRQHTGIQLESTYTAKAFAALLDDAPQLRDQVVLFWNTHNSGSLDLPKARPQDLAPEFGPFLVERSRSNQEL